MEIANRRVGNFEDWPEGEERPAEWERESWWSDPEVQVKRLRDPRIKKWRQGVQKWVDDLPTFEEVPRGIIEGNGERALAELCLTELVICCWVLGLWYFS